MIVRTGADIAALLSGAAVAGWNVPNEDTLQAYLLELLEQEEAIAVREVRLSDGISRIDLMVAIDDDQLADPNRNIGVEVKIKGSAADVVRQLTRYAKCPEILELVLVTTKASHLNVPHQILGKTITIIPLLEGGL